MPFLTFGVWNCTASVTSGIVFPLEVFSPTSKMFMKLWNAGKKLNRKAVKTFTCTYPKVTVTVGMLASLPFINCYLKNRPQTQLIKPLDDALDRGTTPDLHVITEISLIPQEEIKDSVMEYFIPGTANKHLGYFGVTLGPSGTGKTTIVCHACRQYPQGLIYVEITGLKSFPRRLAENMGMRLGPSNIEDMFLGYLSSGCIIMNCHATL